jgi:solute carrier family 13 (sodium-dependent dicarboxylate transporter), member 2/3/5
MDAKRLINLIIGPALFALCCLVLPRGVFESFESRAAIGTVAWMAYWWVTAPIDYAVTAFLPIALNAIFQMTDQTEVIANYASEIILLLLGASIITVSWEETGLDKRIAARFLGLVGSSFRGQLMFWFVLSTVLSSVLPNAVVCATVSPIALSMLKFVGEGDISKSRIGAKLLLYIAYGAGLGGLATPLGGAMNLVVVDYIQQVTGEEFMYVDWVIRFTPIMAVLFIICIIFMLRDVKKGETLGGSKEYFREEYSKMSKISREEVICLVLFIVATVLSFTRQLYADLLPGLKPAYVFITVGLLTFIFSKREKGLKPQRLMLWKSVEGKITWELIYIYAGGLAIGTLINNTGAAEAIGNAVSNAGLSGGLVFVAVIVLFTLLLSDFTSNTATAAISLPIVISIASGMGENTIPYIYIATIGINLSFMLPTSIRAIPVGYGLSPKYMLKEGVKISIVIVILMSLLGYALMKWWPAFSIA